MSEITEAQIKAACRAQLQAEAAGWTEHEGMRAALEAAEVARWQPIETAPKDMTRVVLYDPQNESVLDIGVWDYGQWCTERGSMDATHWMPIPPPPPTATKET